ncbi:uncharacterized protein BO88DRAFT_340795 [Aspergillus vadensis CBS 113365]|uniref:Uncharacterized protein n=1 Tax=Aspergillus vadensis (strain CBS 113365 / IMI 142717 / IBT 24658) TaxID=1448311 RepID=A0A319BA62_ASPVC|nr:hypothetical protein BO88DRAFT_340795 [Aspergillus vadensis CBS 113365]PYH68724.1 hypothetical protein BO88DRAFT_340795 [Aspergillus vadensis CBS 113365]
MLHRLSSVALSYARPGYRDDLYRARRDHLQSLYPDFSGLMHDLACEPISD